MLPKDKGTTVLLLLIMIGVGCTALWAMSISNGEESLRKQIIEQQSANDKLFEKLWAKTVEVCKPARPDREAFAESWTEVVRDQNFIHRRDKIATLFTRLNGKVTSANFDLMVSLAENSRRELLEGQARAVRLKAEHDSLRGGIPTSFVVGSRPEVKITVIKLEEPPKPSLGTMIIKRLFSE